MSIFYKIREQAKKIVAMANEFVLHIKDSEKKAYGEAVAITTKALYYAQSGEVITLEKLIPDGEQVGDAVTTVLNKMIVALNANAAGQELDTLQALVGHYGALLMESLHDGPIEKLFVKFETMFQASR